MKIPLFIVLAMAFMYSQVSSANWIQTLSCEGNSVRLDRDRQNFQLVIEHKDGMESLIKSGAINQENIKDGKIIIPGTLSPGSWNYFATAPRDGGVLLYQIMVSDHSPYSLNVVVSWHKSTNPADEYVPNFAGYKFYNCEYRY